MSYLLFHFLLLHFSSPASPTTSPIDASALAALKSSITPSSIPPFSCLSSWNSSPSFDPCRTSLSCLSCSSSGRITSLTLDPAGYSGHLPPSLSNLSHLQTLDLSSNSFHGPLPSSISRLSNLQSLLLTSNSFTGPIPSSLSSLPALTILDLSYNRFTGTIPASLPPNLVTLDLRRNSLTGVLIRSAFAPLRRLEVADLAGNRLNGTVEGWLLKLPKIQQVNLANNSFENWEVGPAGDGGEELVAVDLGFNRIGGRLPEELAGYGSLVAVTVSYNELRGEIPWEYYGEKKGAAFRRLFLAGNFLEGRVPAEFLAGGMEGRFGDNCLEGCTVDSEMCAPRQKPGWVCKMADSGDGGGRRGGEVGV